ncbi:MAG: HD domain-containing protein [Planctomycetota bacterium]|jgi:hypothetical protein|nr:HD domain-containing protein [Planctomycetota bacterium]MDP6941203.1 HD domain-containing protein [Planctomycetota bacterium]
MLRFDNIIRDPVHGDIPLTAEELRILDTAEMQRLRNIRQLGTAYLVYPGAQHSRFEHSVGTAHFASKMIREINSSRDQNGGRLGGYDDHEERVIRLAALVHDATHLPFGHNIEDQTGLLPRHDVPDRFASMFSLETELGQELERTGVRQQVIGILAPDAVADADRPPAHWREIVSGTIDADMLDYLARDAMFTGLNLQYDSRIFGMFRVERRTQRLYVELESRGYLKEAILSELLRCFDARYFFSERVYYHHAKIASGALIAKAVEIALLEGVVDFPQLQRTTDAGLLSILSRADLGDSPEGKRLRVFVDAYKSRRLPKRAAVYPVYANRNAQEGLIQRFFGAGSSQERRRVEEHLSDLLEEQTGERVPVLLYCPAGHMQLKSARLLVHWPGESDLRPLNDFRDHVPRLLDLENAYQGMWKFYVLALTKNPEILQTLNQICDNEFPEGKNLLKLGVKSLHSATKKETHGV